STSWRRSSASTPLPEGEGMAGQLQRLREHIETATKLQSVVQTIRALAEVNVRRSQSVAGDVDRYARSVHVAMHVVLRSLSRQERRPLHHPGSASPAPAASKPGPLVAVLITSDQ